MKTSMEHWWKDIDRGKQKFWKVPRLRPFVLLVRAACRWRRVWSIGGKILTEENRSAWRNACFITTFPTTKSHTGSNPGRRGERPVTNCLSHNGLLEIKIVSNYVQKFSPHCPLNTRRLGYTDKSVYAVKGNSHCLFWDLCLFVCFPGVTTHCGCIFTAW